MRECVNNAPTIVLGHRETILKAKAEDLENKLSAMQEFREKAVEIVNVAVADVARETTDNLRGLISQDAEMLFDSLQNRAENSKDSETGITR